MKTLEIADGDINVDVPTGSWTYVSGVNKGAQDVARHLLCEFDEFFNEGNELITLTVDAAAYGVSDTLVTQFIYAAMNRLIIKQRFTDDNDRILKVNQLRTRTIGLSTVVFMVEVLFSNGDIVSVTDAVKLKPVKLNHIMNPNDFVENALRGDGIEE